MSSEPIAGDSENKQLPVAAGDDAVVIEDADDAELMAEVVKLKNELSKSSEVEHKVVPKLGQDSSIKEGFYDVRVAVVGNVDSGKSTLIGVLTGGELDNGRGKARSKVFVHRHEAENGRTSCISQHIMGFNDKHEVVHQNVAASATAASKTKAWSSIVDGSKSVVTFIDLAGHERYLKTTIAGLTGCFPDYAVVIINSLAGVTKMTKEHLGVVIALEIPLCCVVSKVDMCPENVLRRTKKQLFKILKSPAAGKLPINIRSSADIETVTSTQSTRLCPVFFLSSVTGKNLNLLTEYLSILTPRRDWTDVTQEPTEFAIDETFNVTGVGIVVSGTVSRGTLKANSELLLGPDTDGTFTPIVVRTIHAKRVSVESCQAGDSCAISLRSLNKKKTLKRQHIRRGMVLVDPAANPIATRSFEAEVLVLHHPTTIKMCYQAVIHCGNIRQTASIDQINKECLRTGDKALIRWTFMIRPEFIHPGQRFIFREGSTKGIGKVVRPIVGEEAKDLGNTNLLLRKKERKHKDGGPEQTPAAAEAKADVATTEAESKKPADASTSSEFPEDDQGQGKPQHRTWATVRNDKRKLKDERAKLEGKPVKEKPASKKEDGVAEKKQVKQAVSGAPSASVSAAPKSQGTSKAESAFPVKKPAAKARAHQQQQPAKPAASATKADERTSGDAAGAAGASSAKKAAGKPKEAHAAAKASATKADERTVGSAAAEKTKAKR